ncbi:MAG TPA: (2Fe-2S)-binding protein [Thermoanaerobaculia bacterium]|nr:(2Fe-2S)-binding protein [Thermoanaerobaculia bacterium]
MSRPSALPLDAPEAPCSDESCSVTTPDAANLCPASQTIGSNVDLITVKALLTGDALRRLDGKAYRFCPAPGCDVVYFDIAADSIFRKSDLTVRVGQKETQDPIPVCYCFDFSVADLRRDLAARGKTEIPAIIATNVKAGHCACEVKNPQGTCCLGNVSRAVKGLQSEIRLATA